MRNGKKYRAVKGAIAQKEKARTAQELLAGAMSWVMARSIER